MRTVQGSRVVPDGGVSGSTLTIPCGDILLSDEQSVGFGTKNENIDIPGVDSRLYANR